MLKTILLKGLGKTNTSEEEFDKKTVPSSLKWTVQEIRYFTSRVVNANEIYLYKATVQVVALNTQVMNVLKRPYPADVTIEAGMDLRLTGVTDGTATDYIIEVIIDEVAV